LLAGRACSLHSPGQLLFNPDKVVGMQLEPRQGKRPMPHRDPLVSGTQRRAVHQVHEEDVEERGRHEERACDQDVAQPGDVRVPDELAILLDAHGSTDEPFPIETAGPGIAAKEEQQGHRPQPLPHLGAL
jgi:hypothetical protein